MEIPNDGHDLPDDSDYSFENVHIAENARRGEYCVKEKVYIVILKKNLTDETAP
jgi:hypothetical protein